MLLSVKFILYLLNCVLFILRGIVENFCQWPIFSETLIKIWLHFVYMYLLSQYTPLNRTYRYNLWIHCSKCTCWSPVLGRIFLNFVCKFLRTTFLQKLPDTPLPLRTAICLIKLFHCFWRKFAASVRFAILGLLAHILLPTFLLGSSKWAHVSSPVTRLSNTFFWYFGFLLIFLVLFQQFLSNLYSCTLVLVNE